jgi:hypothetical protein
LMALLVRSPTETVDPVMEINRCSPVSSARWATWIEFGRGCGTLPVERGHSRGPGNDGHDARHRAKGIELDDLAIGLLGHVELVGPAELHRGQTGRWFMP